MRKIIFLCSILFTGIVFAQNESANNKEQKLDRKAFYFRGEYAMERVMNDSTKFFADSIPVGLTGVVRVKTEILPDGSIGRTSVIESMGRKFDTEAIRLVKLLPGWRAAKRHRELVATFVEIDVKFKEFHKPQKVDNRIYTVVDTYPEFPGGYGGMVRFIQNNVKYPQISLELNEEGKVFVEFVVSKSGLVKSVKVVRGVSDDLDAEALRVVKKMPRWKPAENKGKKVNCLFTIPINFKIG